MDPRCSLCRSAGGEVVWQDVTHRVVLVDEPALPGYCRIVWNAHVAELGDLSTGERASLLRTVGQVEAAIRAVLVPDKINVAALGNVVPHLHVHVVPRWRDDPWFPGSVWAPSEQLPCARVGAAASVARLRQRLRSGFLGSR